VCWAAIRSEVGRCSRLPRPSPQLRHRDKVTVRPDNPQHLHSIPQTPPQCSHEVLCVPRGHSPAAIRPRSSRPYPAPPLRSQHAHAPAKLHNHEAPPLPSAPCLVNSSSEMPHRHPRNPQLASRRYRNRNSHGTTSSHSVERAAGLDRVVLLLELSASHITDLPP
jgi:hypothetical protein